MAEIIVHNHPVITVNGKPLTKEQAITVKTALIAFDLDLRSAPLGKDPLGAQVTANYLEQVKELTRLLNFSVSDKDTLPTYSKKGVGVGHGH